MQPSKYSRVRLFGRRVSPEDLPNDPVDRCGYFCFSTGPNDPFIKCCVMHDKLYVGKPCTRKEADQAFYECCLQIAGEDRGLKIRAKIYYGIVRSVGWLFW